MSHHGPFGGNALQALTEADERDLHRVRPAARHQLDGERGERGAHRLGGAADGDQPVRDLQVHHDPASVVRAERHQAGIRGERAARVEHGGRGRRQPPELALALCPPRRGRVPVGRRHPQIQRVRGQVRGEDGRQRLAAPGVHPRQVPQAVVEQVDRRVVRAQPQGPLRGGGIAFGRGKPPSERALPQPLPAPPSQRRQQAGRQQARGGELRHFHRMGSGARLSVRRGVYRGLHERGHVGAGRGILEVAQRGRLHMLGHGLDAGAVGVGRHLEDPAGADQGRVREFRAVGLYPVLVQLEDLVVPPPVTEMVLGDLPQRYVVAVAGGRDDVDLLLAGLLRGRRLRGGAGHEGRRRQLVRLH
jgi:hypothetical protein